MIRSTCASLAVVALVALCLVVGCSSKAKGVRVTGTITSDRKPIPLSNEGVLQVIFVPAKGGKNTYAARVDYATGAYEIDAIPEGSYRVCIEVLDPYPSQDKLKGQFNTQNSPIVREVTDGLKIDVDVAQEARSGRPPAEQK